ncbi:carbohydrate ABC transporter permease [Cohnella fermenti]|uniref:Carbohydrate ABC transporter permease n=1 Tax=Cohnella fermenti TaxID=2565925 RepID=A0A4S4BHH2_9BACL|nr:carbohydrate ABC transporter permease [Cohnella fermenti]THF74012.1 carbohydrate ABC transporter permease [Cohnella fermenti]
MGKKFNLVADGILYLILLLIVLFIALPFSYILFSSFSTNAEYYSRGFYILPHKWTINAYGYLAMNENFMQAYRNTFVLTACGTAISLGFTLFMAYGLSKRWLRGRRLLNMLVLFTMIFHGGMIPTYLLVSELHLLNSYWSIYLTGAIFPFLLIIMRSFFASFPPELEEAARMDGCGELQLLLRIVLPLSIPSVVTIALMYGVAHWNSYFQAILYLNDSAKWPIQSFLRQFLLDSDTGMLRSVGSYEYGPPVKMAAVIVTALPLLLCYPFLQKYFNKGMLVGSIKG